MAFFNKLKNRLMGVREKWSGGLISLFSGSSIDDNFWDKLEELLISGDVGVDLTEELLDELKIKVRQKGIRMPEELLQIFSSMLIDRMNSVEGMGEGVSLASSPTAVLLVGVNGSGKTTTAGKLASQFAGEGKKVILAAADTFRAAAIEQLRVWGDELGIRVISQQQGSDAAAVAFDAINAAKASKADVVIIDTAGRLHSKHNLMTELNKIYRIVEKELGRDAIESLLVLDAVMGQNGFRQAEAFNKAMSLSGVVLAKYDNTAKGGIILAIAHKLGLPIKYVGLGEGVEDLRPFESKAFVNALLGINGNVREA